MYQGETKQIHLPAMDAIISIIKKGKTVFYFEVKFVYERNSLIFDDSKIRLKADLAKQVIEPVFIWFKCRGKTQNISSGTSQVLSNTFQRWLNNISENSQQLSKIA
jgi:hypothetical protein